MKYERRYMNLLRNLLARFTGQLTKDEADAVELGANAVELLARAERQNDYGSFVHRIRKERGAAPVPVTNYSLTTMECPVCGAWIGKESRLKHTPHELLQCMQIAVNCSKGVDIDCEHCPVAQVPHDASLDCDGAMLQEAVNLIDRLLGGEIGPEA